MEGLISPARTESRHRWFDVARLRFVLSVHHDRYRPLKVIREQPAGRHDSDTCGSPLAHALGQGWVAGTGRRLRTAHLIGHGGVTRRFRDHDHRKRGEHCPPLAGSVNDEGTSAAAS
jgi:hypothetical protein